MTTLQAIFLGLVQGITEFLPVSSNAHLRVIPAFLGWPDPGAAFTAVIQWGTLLATIVYFRSDLATLLFGTFQGLREKRALTNQHSRVALGIVVGTIPIGILGITFKKAIEHDLRSLQVIAFALIGMAVLLGISEVTARHTRNFSQITFLDAVLVGCGQAAALIPGASRSGSTITAGLFLGLKREAAARFSFLLSLPAVGAAGLLELKEVVKTHGMTGDIIQPTIIATVVAFFSGLAVIAFLLKFLQSRSTMLFIVWRIALGGALLFALHTGKLKPDTGLHQDEPRVAVQQTK